MLLQKLPTNAIKAGKGKENNITKNNTKINQMPKPSFNSVRRYDDTENLQRRLLTYRNSVFDQLSTSDNINNNDNNDNNDNNNNNSNNINNNNNNNNNNSNNNEDICSTKNNWKN